MSDEIREQLSTLVDDELSDVEQPLLLGRLQRDRELRACLGRYQLIGEVMRGSGATTTLGVADQVQQALAGDAPMSAGGTARSVWGKPLAGAAIAASVALVAVLSVTSLQNDGNPASGVNELASAKPASVPDAGVSAPATTRVTEIDDGQWDRIQPQVDKRLSGYLVNHNEYAASHGVQGVMPYVRIVGFDSNE